MVRDNATRFVDRFGLPYESIFDPDGETLLAFHGTLPPNSIPSFVVIDQQGRIAAIARGQLDDATMDKMLDRVLQ